MQPEPEPEQAEMQIPDAAAPEEHGVEMPAAPDTAGAAEPSPAVLPPEDERVTQAQQLAASGDAAGAVDLYRAMLLERPHDVDLRLQLAKLYEARGEALMALEQYEAAREVDDGDVRVLLDLAVTLAGLRRFDAAERELRRVLKLDPLNADAYAHLGMVSFRRGLYAQAELELKRAIELDPDCALGYFYRGESLNQLNRVDEALEMLEMAAQLLPANPRTYYLMGILFDKKSRPEEAAAMYRKAREVAAA